MARPTKRNADYFPHYLPGKKMKYLRKKFGNDGYSTWFIILEQLTDANDHHILADDFNLTLLADECMIETDLLVKIIDELCMLGALNLELWTEAKILYSEELRNSLEDAYSRRANNIISTAEIKAKYLQKEFTPTKTHKQEEFPPTETELMPYKNTQSKVKKSKVESRETKQPPEIHPAAQKILGQAKPYNPEANLAETDEELFKLVYEKIDSDRTWWYGVKHYTKIDPFPSEWIEVTIKKWASFVIRQRPYELRNWKKLESSLKNWLLREQRPPLPEKLVING